MRDASSDRGRIVVQGLTRRFGARVALQPLDLEIGPGGITGLLGPNGSGKSTFLRLLLGLVSPDAGGAVVDGARLEGDGLAIRRRVTYLTGEVHVYGELTGREHLAWCLRGRGRAARTRAAAIAGRFELPLDQRVRGYSHGMKRQLLLAAALAPDVRVRILDEPTEGLDPTRRGEVLELLEAEAARGTTILFSSHHLGEVERACTRRVFLRRGERLDERAAEALVERARAALRISWVREPAEADVRAALGERTGELALDGERATLFFPEGGGPRALERLLASERLPEVRALQYGELSLSDVYRELYGVEGV